MNRTTWLVAGLLVAGCGGKHPGSYNTNATQSAQAASPTDKADALWEQRVNEAKLQEAIAAYEEILATDPGSSHALQRLTRAWYFWGDAFTTDKDVQIERWGRAIEYGTRCIGLNTQIQEAIAGGAKEKDAVEYATDDDVPCLYWTASALGKWGKAQGIARTLKHLPTVKAYISKVEQLDPAYYNHGPARYWGAYYAALPSFAGQDLDKSAEYFASSLQGAPYYLPTHLLRAEMLAVPTQDVAMFDADLVAVLSSDPDAVPEAGITPENTRDQLKARELFAKRGELFDRKTLEAAGPAPELPDAPVSPPPAPQPAPGDESPAGDEAPTEGEAPAEGAATEGALGDAGPSEEASATEAGSDVEPPTPSSDDP